MKRLYLLLLPLTVLASCQTDDRLDERSQLTPMSPVTRSEDAPDAPRPPQYATARNIGAVTIGRKLDKYIESFTVRNMGDALMSLKWRGTAVPGDQRLNEIANELSISPYDLKTTHYYIEIAPKTPEDLGLLSEDSTLYYTPLPFDHEIIGTGTLAHAPAEYDPETGAMKIVGPVSPIYCIIPITRRMPDDVSYKILAHLYMPHMTDAPLAEAVGTPLLSHTFAELLVDQAFFMSGAKTREELGAEKSWRPSGRIQVYDTELKKYVGVPGVRVYIGNHGRNILTHTDENGKFSIPTYEKNCKGFVSYNIEWSSEEYKLFDTSGTLAIYHCGQQHYPLDLRIEQGGETFGLATVARGLYYHYKEEFNDWERIADYRHKDYRFTVNYYHSHNPKMNGEFHYPFHKNISIWGKDVNGKIRSSSSIISTTFHEQAHAAMWYRKGNEYYLDFHKIMRESWATFVGWHLTRKLYFKSGYDNSSNIYQRYDEVGNTIYFEIDPFNNLQYYTLDDFQSGDKYSPLFIDFVDNLNQQKFQKLVNSNTQTYPDDNIEIDKSKYNLFWLIAAQAQKMTTFKTYVLQHAEDLGIDQQDINDYFSFYGI